jgi:iron complex outermembrane recepter protein
MIKIKPITFALALALYGNAPSAQVVILEEVIVTAQKRSESAQDIPSTVNVIGGDTLKGQVNWPRLIQSSNE